MKTLFNVLSTVFLMLGAIIGAGFVSGAELVSFFGAENFLSPVIIATVLTSLVFCLIFSVVKFYDSKKLCVENLLGGKKIYSICTCFSSYIFTASMLAGMDALWNSLKVLNGAPVFSLPCIALISVFSKYGVKGLERLNLILMPLVLIIVNVLIFSRQNLEFCPFSIPTLNQTVNAGLYVFMNTFISIPVMRACANNKSKKSLCISSIIVAIVVGTQMLIILCVISKNIILCKTDMPLFDVINSGGFSVLFFACLLIGSLTSAFSAYYPAYCFAKRKGGGFGVVFSAVLVLILSRLGLGVIVKYLYPLIGGLGVLFVVRSLVGIKNSVNADNKHNHFSYGGNYVKKEKEQK